MHIVNLDPAADEFSYPVAADIRELISLADVMEEMNLGPNGALLYCMEYFEDSLEDWLSETLEGYGEDDCIIFDCPGQIELYSHHTAFRSFVDQMTAWGWRLVAVYMLDSQFITDGAKFIAGCMQCQAAMMNLELPHVNVMSKVDLVEDKSVLEPYLHPDHPLLVGGRRGKRGRGGRQSYLSTRRTAATHSHSFLGRGAPAPAVTRRVA